MNAKLLKGIDWFFLKRAKKSVAFASSRNKFKMI